MLCTKWVYVRATCDVSSHLYWSGISALRIMASSVASAGVYLPVLLPKRSAPRTGSGLASVAAENCWNLSGLLCSPSDSRLRRMS